MRGKSPKKPTRPYTEYNIFFLLERALIHQSHPENEDTVMSMPAKEEVELIPRAPRYQDLVLPANWYIPQGKKKRKHRKTQGMISFIDLTKHVSAQWKTIDEATKQYCTAVSEIGREVYNKKMGAYKETLPPSKGQKLQKTKQQKQKQLQKTKQHKLTQPTSKVSGQQNASKKNSSEENPDVVVSSLLNPPKLAFDNGIEHYLKCLVEEEQEQSASLGASVSFLGSNEVDPLWVDMEETAIMSLWTSCASTPQQSSTVPAKPISYNDAPAFYLCQPIGPLADEIPLQKEYHQHHFYDNNV